MSNSKRYFIVALTIIVIIAGIVFLRSLLAVPGLDKPIKVQDGSVQVTSVERVDYFEAPNGQKVSPSKANQFVLVEVNVKGTVPLAGATSGFQDLLSGKWQLKDANGVSYSLSGLTSGKMIFQVDSSATGLVLELGDNVKIPLDRTKFVLPTSKPARRQTDLLASVSKKGKIVFASARGSTSSASWNLYIMNPDGSDMHLLTEVGVNPDCSPDGKHVVANNYSGGIFIIDLDGTNRVDILPEQSFSQSPKWSSDGKQIVYAQSEIYIMNADGSEQTRLTFDQYSKDGPIWTPEGQIAFHELGADKYHVMNKDGSSVKEITKEMYDGFKQEWSPDKSAYVAENPDTHKITIFSPDGSVSVGLLQDEIRDFGPTWCP